MTISYEAARDFLYREARYLDDKDWDSWLELYAADATFWMPAWDDEDKLTEDPPEGNLADLVRQPQRPGRPSVPHPHRALQRHHSGLPAPRTTSATWS